MLKAGVLLYVTVICVSIFLSLGLFVVHTEIFGETKLPATSAQVEDDSAFARKLDFQEDIRAHIRWYQRHAFFLYWMWTVGSGLSLILTTLASYLIAIGYGQEGKRKALLAAIPAFAALITALLGHYQVREIWQLRELGRIEAQALLNDVRLLTSDDKFEMRKLLAPYRNQLNEIERRQALKYFEHIGGTGENGGAK